MIPLSIKVWGIRILILAGIIGLNWLTRSPIPSLGLTVAWCPNGLFLVAFMRGALHLPRFLEPVRPIEPVLYRALGVGLVKRVVATRMWPLVMGNAPPAKAKNRHELLVRAELSAKGAEICHLATFLLALCVALLYLAGGRRAVAAWILAFNLVLNGYPVMLQRVHRWRIQRLRKLAHKRPDDNEG